MVNFSEMVVNRHLEFFEKIRNFTFGIGYSGSIHRVS